MARAKKFNPKAYQKQQIALLDGVLQKLADELGYTISKPLEAGFSLVMLASIRNEPTIGYRVTKSGKPRLTNCGTMIALVGSYPESFVQEYLIENGLELHIVETHLGDIEYVRINPSDNRMRKIIIDEFLANENGK